MERLADAKVDDARLWQRLVAKARIRLACPVAEAILPRMKVPRPAICLQRGQNWRHVTSQVCQVEVRPSIAMRVIGKRHALKEREVDASSSGLVYQPLDVLGARDGHGVPPGAEHLTAAAD